MSTDPHQEQPGAFGLAVTVDVPLPGLEAPSGARRGRRVDCRLLGREEIEGRLEEGRLKLLGHDGSGMTRVEYHEHSSGATLLRTTSFGEHLILEGGREVISGSGPNAALWQRYVLGQVLPLTASIQGLEVFHAAAVVVNDAVVVLAGPSGAGKSSIAATLIGGEQAGFFADDVLAIDATAHGLIAYPGTTLLGVPRDLPAAGAGDLLGRPAVLGDTRKVMLVVDGERRPLPVGSFFRLTPDETVAAPRLEACLPDRLMATTFDGVTRAPERLVRLLRVAAQLAADGRALELRFPPHTDARVLAETLLARVDGEARHRAV